MEIWHQGRLIEIARRVDVLANCFIKRNSTTKSLEIPRSNEEPAPDGIAMRTLVTDDEEGVF